MRLRGGVPPASARFDDILRTVPPLEQFTISVSDLDWRRLLTPWDWLLRGMRIEPVFMTCFGDWILRAEDGSIHFLDLGAGNLRKLASSRVEFDRLLQDPKVRSELLMDDLVKLLRDRGVVLKPGQCFGYKIPLIVGGQLVAENIEPTMHMIHQSTIGQIAAQAKDMPPGTRISKFEDDSELP